MTGPAILSRDLTVSEAELAALFADVEVRPDGCWLWTGYLNEGGYAQANRSTAVHRRCYTLMRGPVAPREPLDHLCHTRDTSCPGGRTCIHRRCINPDHLEPVTTRENNLRGRGFVSAKAEQGECEDGHAFTPENTRIRKNGTRNCKECARRRCRESYRRVRAK